ncbi:MAG: D-glycero-beta-D-manno-heptose-7-phosphate kinase [Alphaproteobacteria bacterium]|nr:D-glycero-beta-D-manno-heptose-7-phosphate kinase [Alphaproteobacteria bacterium]
MKHHLDNWLRSLRNINVLCVGDVILDQYVYGDVDRVSPEAPIPVLNINSRSYVVGGAGNVACNISAIGGVANLVAVTGDDLAGSQINNLLDDDAGVINNLISGSDYPTTVKTRFVADGQHLLRVDDEVIDVYSTQFLENIFSTVESLLDQGPPGVIVLSDYGKGVLSETVTRNIIKAAKVLNIPVVIDPKGTNYSKYYGADILTPNRKELSESSLLPTRTSDEIVSAAEKLIDQFAIGSVLVTRGKEGMSLIKPNCTPLHLPALAREIFDVSGAGDTVVAVMAAGVAAGMEAAEAAELANIAAGLVVGKIGTAVVRNIDLLHALNGTVSVEKNIIDKNQLNKKITEWRSRGLLIGFTNGCFDLMHPGHISLLEQAKSECDRLIIGLNSDESVTRLKGEGRPVQNAVARALVLASLSSVDAVVIFDDDTPIDLIKLMRPDVLVKGADYLLADVVGGEFVCSYGGRIVLADLIDGYSTTETIARLLC